MGLILLAALALAMPPDAPKATPTAPTATETASTASDPVVAGSMGRVGYPWYDREADAIKPVRLYVPPKPSTRTTTTSSTPNAPGLWTIGDILPTLLMVAALAALVVVAVWFWNRYEGNQDARRSKVKAADEVHEGVELPEDLRRQVRSDDPWAEANRLKDRGDLAGAIVHLFAHQLITLGRMGLVRLSPGRTARQLHRAIGHDELKGLVRPSLRQFEAVYYGHRMPTPDEFAEVWNAAEMFQVVAAREAKR